MPYPTPLAYKSNWESNMTTWGAFHQNDVSTGSFDEKLLSTYYDGGWVYFRIKDYTGTSSWGTVATDFIDFYRDEYVVPNNGGVPGYWNFTHGLTEDFLRNADTDSRDAVRDLLALNAAFAPDTTPLSSTVSAELSREVAYTVMAYLNAERCGAARRVPRLSQLLEQMLGHMDQWFVSQSADYVRPFMFALTAQALISYNEAIGDSRIVPLLEIGAQWIWDHTWLPADLCFMYTDRNVPSGGQEPAPDLNLLVLPVFGYLYHQTGDTKWIDRGDLIFQGGVVGAGSAGNPNGAYLAGSGKQFNQNYRWSFDYLTWREAAPLSSPPGGGSPPPAPSTSDATFSMLVPVKRETWAEHFESRGWTCPQDQIDAGYPLFIQPTALTAQFVETIDLGVVINEGTTVALQYSVQPIEGVVDAVPTLSLSADNVTFTDHAGQTSVFATGFRYVKIQIDFTGEDDKAVARVPGMRIRVYLKQKRDGGSGTALAVDYTGPSSPADKGTLVYFNKAFLDVDQITVTARYQSGLASGGQAIAYHNFQDVPNPTFFRVFVVNSATGAAINGDFDWDAKGS